MKRLKMYVLLLAISIVSTIIANHLNSFSEGFNRGVNDAHEKRTLLYFSFKYYKGSSTTNEISFQGNPIPIEIRKGYVSVPKELLDNAFGTLGYNLYYANEVFMMLCVLPLIIGYIWVLVLLFKLLRSVLKSKLFDSKNLSRISTIGFILLGIEIIQLITCFLSYYSFNKLFTINPYEIDYWSILESSNFVLIFIILAMNELLRIAITMKEEQELTI